MEIKSNKILKLTILTFSLFMMFVLLFSPKVCAANVTLTFPDKVFYECVRDEMREEGFLVSNNDSTKSIVITEENKNSIQHLSIIPDVDINGETIYEETVDVSGIEQFPNLTWVFIGANKVNNLSELKKLNSLNSLYIYVSNKQELNNLSKLSQVENLTIEIEDDYSIDLNWVVGMTSLKTLKIYSEKGYINLSSISKLPNIGSLTIGFANQNDLNIISNLTNIQSLKLNSTYNNISILSNMNNLIDLTIYNYDNILPEGISSLTNIRSLNINLMELSDISFLKNMTNLKELDLGYNKISDISALKNLTNLTKLDLSSNKISDISTLSYLTNLTTLYIYNNQISNTSSLNDLHKLKYFSLSTQKLSDYIDITDGTTTYKLPEIFVQAQNSSNRAYYSTYGKLNCTNCTLSSNKNSIIINNNLKEGDTVTVEISGGAASGTTWTLNTVLPFPDVSKNAWSYEGIKYAYKRKLITGFGDGTFGPTSNLNRAMVATILYRMEGSPKVTFKNIFPDVPAGVWFSDPIEWAYENGIVTGYKTLGTFGPGDNITRQDLAVMLKRYAEYKGMYNTSNINSLEGYKDYGSVSQYARDAMKWAVGNGIITGNNGGTTLDPFQNATRAQAATMIMRFGKNIFKWN